MTTARPTVTCEMQHPTLHVPDVEVAVEFYTEKLGFSVGFTWGNPPTIAGVNLGQVSMHLQQGEPHPEGCSVYFVVGDADELFEFQKGAGVEVVEPPDDRPWGLRDYQVKDAWGHKLGFGHRLPESGPPVEIEREDVTVRLEKRLVAVLHDLAKHKRMSLGSCLEETLLHTFERHGDGVASPHGPATLRHIEMLKAKHGIDYDTHASYRFKEK